MILYWLFVIAGFLLLLLFIHEKCKAYTVKATLIKTAVSAIFMATGLLTAYNVPADSPARGMAFLIVAGSLFGLFGDIFLDLKYVHRSDETLYTYAGFCTFFIMHTIIVIGLIRYFGGAVGVLWTLLPLLVGFAVGIGNVFLGPVMKLDYTGYKGITMAYGGLLIGATLLTLVYAVKSGFASPFLTVMLVGYVLFLVSDLILSQTYFAGKEGRFFIASNYATYYAAMYLFASAAIYLA